MSELDNSYRHIFTPSLVREAILYDEHGDPLAVSAIQQLIVDVGTKLAGEELYLDVMQAIDWGSTYLITEAGTYTVKSGSGVLMRLVFMNVDASASTVTVYDNTAGSGVVIMPTQNMTTTEISANAPYSVWIGAAFTTGLTIVTTGATDILVVYR